MSVMRFSGRPYVNLERHIIIRRFEILLPECDVHWHCSLLPLNSVQTSEDRYSIAFLLRHRLPLFLGYINLDTVGVVILRLSHFYGCHTEVTALFAEIHSVAIIDGDNDTLLCGVRTLGSARTPPLISGGQFSFRNLLP